MKKITSLKEHKNGKKEVAEMLDEDCQSILSNFFYMDFEIINEDGLYKVKINKNNQLETTASISAEIFNEIYQGRYFSQLSDIICIFMSMINEQEEFLHTEFHYVTDYNTPDTLITCDVVTEQGLIYRDVKVEVEVKEGEEVLKFFYSDGIELTDVKKWHQD